LFWTVAVDDRDVTVDLAAGTATLRGLNVHMEDYHDFENALLDDGAPPTASTVSYTVTWTATGDATDFTDPAHQYRGRLRPAIAQMEWTARAARFEYRSAPLDTSTTDLAWLGTESNGSYF
jgi:hypothetical protein